MISLQPFAARLRRKFGTGSLVDAATERRVLAPSFTSDRPAAIGLPGEIDRAQAFFLSREHELARISGGRRLEGETVAYRLEDALVARGIVHAGGRSEIYRGDGPRFLTVDRPQRRSAGLLSTSVTAETFFGDWLIESFSIALLSDRLGVPPVSFAKRPWLHQPGYEALLALAPEPVTAARFDELWIVDDRGMNPDRGGRLAELRRRVRSKTGRSDGPEKVLLARGRLGAARDMSNADEVEAHLRGAGYAIVHPEEETPADLAGKLADARVVVTTEGSAQTHALLSMRDGGTLVILQPPLRFTAPGKDMSDWLGLRYAFLVGEPDGEGFHVDLRRLDALLDVVERV